MSTDYLRHAHFIHNAKFTQIGNVLRKVAIIGGGLSGLTAAIQLSGHDIHVTLFEKKTYPFHRVCGEYISNETVPFLKENGLFPEALRPAQINRAEVSSVSGKKIELALKMGGFGISRYRFDHFLFEKAKSMGVKVYENTEVEDVRFSDEGFELQASGKKVVADVVLGSFGKRSKLDIHWRRAFIQKRSPYVGVKYHVKTNHPRNVIALHNFRNGYCGISNVEDEKTNLCYLTHRDNLKEFKNIGEMEENILYENPFLRKIFSESEFLFDKPEVINEISFETKAPVENHVLMSGDAAGMITPLCGNGMAMAIHSGKIAAGLIARFCQEKISRAEMENEYAAQWRALFARRLWAGRQIQNLFGRAVVSNLAVALVRSVQPLGPYLVSLTHGKPF